METKNHTISYSKIIGCPGCYRQLCRLKEINGIPLVVFKHKGAFLTALEMTVKCLGCNRGFIVDARQGIIDEVDLGTIT